MLTRPKIWRWKSGKFCLCYRGLAVTRKSLTKLKRIESIIRWRDRTGVQPLYEYRKETYEIK